MFVSEAPSFGVVSEGDDLATASTYAKVEAECHSSWDIIRFVQEGNMVLFGEIYRRYAPTGYPRVVNDYWAKY